MKRVLIIAAIVVAGLVVLAIIVSSVAFPVLRYLSRPRDLPLAKRNGRALAAVRGQTIVVVIAHPDDAEWYAGGTLALLARHGNRIVVVDGTSGEKGGNLPNLGRIREGEQRNAGKVIGYKEILFLRHPDRGLVDNATFRAQLLAIYKQIKPSILITFDAAEQALGYRHPDHRAAGAASLSMAEDFPTIRAAYLFSSAGPNTIVDVASVTRVKALALAQHKSQHNESGGAHFLLSLLRFLPHPSSSGDNFGSAGPYPQIRIKWGEPFRLVRLSHRG